MPDTTNAEFIDQLQASPLATVAKFYASCLSDNVRATVYAEVELGLSPEQAAAQHVGFSDRSLGKHIPSNRTKLGTQLRSLLTELDIYKGNGRETLRGYVTQPIIDAQGDIIGIRGLKLDPHAAGAPVIVLGQSTVASEPTPIPTIDDQPNQAAQHNQPTRTQPTTNHSPSPRATNNDTSELRVEQSQLVFTRDDRQYRIRGLEKNTSTSQLRVNLMASRDGLVHLDALDLVKARSRTSFIKAAATELYCEVETIKKDIGQLLLQLDRVLTVGTIDWE